jgi:hypothetical protein
MGPRDAGARRAGLLLAVVLVASQASAWFHAAAISHVACLEHGEAVHQQRTLGRADMRPTRPAEGRIEEGDAGAAAGHDHCGNAALLRWRDVALSAPAALAALVPVLAAPPAAPSRTHAALATVYRLAPKTSPPPCA